MTTALDQTVREIAERSGDVLVSVDLSGRITYVSPAIQRFGHAPEDIVGGNGVELIHPQDRERFIANSLALLRGEVIPGADRRHRLRRGDGTWAWIEGAPELLRDETGRVVGFVNALRDITARQEAEAALLQAERRFRLITESSPDIILQTDLAGRLVFVSPAIRAYGYEPADLVGTSFGALVHPDDLPRAAANRARTLRGEPVLDSGRRTNRYRTASGQWVWLEGNPRVLHDEAGAIIGTVNVLRDVTAQHEQTVLFETAFEHAAIGKALVALDGRFLRVNQAFARMLGYSPADMLALDFQSLTFPEDLDADVGRLRQLVAGEVGTYTLDKRYVRKDGELVWGRLSVSMARNPDGSPMLFIAQIQDQTDQKRAEAALRESEARHRIIAETTADLITLADLDGTLTFVSPSVRQIGYQPEALIGTKFADNVHPDDVGATWLGLKAMIAGGPSQRFRWRARHGMTGEWLWMESSPSLKRDAETGRPTGLIDVVRNISRQVEQEEALRAAQSDAEAATAVKAQFVANMSHEIRNPLTAVLGFSETLSRSTTLSPADLRYVQRIVGAGSALLAIVNDILDFSKLETGMVTITPRPTAVVAVAQESLGLFESQAAAKGIGLELECGADVPDLALLDGSRLRQILINLAANAVKFTDAGTVSLKVSSAREGALCFEVSDTGPGLSEADCGRLFQRFTQLDAGSRRQGGTGLGLAICKGLAEAMGGSIGVRSELGVGSTFHVTIPFAPAEDGPAVPLSVSASPMDGLRILVVDDHPANRELAALLLHSQNAVVTTAENGRAALVQLAAAPFDAVLLDLRLPDLDGDEILRRLRSDAGPNQHIPALAFTAELESHGEATREGFDGVVQKPLDTAAFFGTILDAVPGLKFH